MEMTANAATTIDQSSSVATEENPQSEPTSAVKDAYMARNAGIPTDQTQQADGSTENGVREPPNEEAYKGKSDCNAMSGHHSTHQVISNGVLHPKGEALCSQEGEVTVPDCQNLYRNSFTYHCLQDNRNLDFDGAIQFLEQCEREKSRVLIHCMSGKNRSAAIVIAFLMKSKGWGLAQCFQLVKDRRPQVQLTDASQRQLVEYEQKLFGPSAGTLAQSVVPAESFPSIIGFGFPKPAGETQVPTFNQMPASSIFEPVSPNNVPSNFTFGAQRTMEVNPPGNNNGVVPPISSDNQMDSS